MPKHYSPSMIFTIAAFLLTAVAMTSCVGTPTTRMGMVKNDETGLMIGSTVENSILTDASFHKNKKVKVRIRNTSGDTAFDLVGFRSQIENAYSSIGFEPTSSDDFGLLIDVNVQYSGQIQTNMSAEYAFLGAAAGGLAGAKVGTTRADVGIGAVSGATLGSIVGSFVTDDTYIIITKVTVATIKKSSASKPAKSITFSRSPQPDEERYKDAESGTQSLKKTIQTGIAVYAGGRNTSQSTISSMVKQRIARIVSNII